MSAAGPKMPHHSTALTSGEKYGSPCSEIQEDDIQTDRGTQTALPQCPEKASINKQGLGGPSALTWKAMQAAPMDWGSWDPGISWVGESQGL